MSTKEQNKFDHYDIEEKLFIVEGIKIATHRDIQRLVEDSSPEELATFFQSRQYYTLSAALRDVVHVQELLKKCFEGSVAEHLVEEDPVYRYFKVNYFLR